MMQASKQEVTMRFYTLALLSLVLIGCVSRETGKSAATIVELAKAQQHEDTDLPTCKKLAEGIRVLGQAIHDTSDKEAKPVITADEARANPDLAVGRAQVQAESLRTAYKFTQMAWDLAYWLGGLAASALTAATGIKFTGIINGWRKAKKVLSGTVSAIQSYRDGHPEHKSMIDGYLNAAHDKIGKMAHQYIAHEKSNGIEKIVPRADTS